MGGQPLQFTAIAPGLDHTCAVEAGGATYCWGCNTRGQAGGIGGDAGLMDRPANAGADKQNAVSVSAGAAHTCLLGAQSRVRCWGSEARGALGDGLPASETTLQAELVDTGGPVTAVSLSENHTCAIDTNRRAACWGDNSAGQLGNPDAGAALESPGSRVVGGQALAIATGGAFTCGIAGDNGVACFGSNQHGELGRSGPPDMAPHPIPEPVVRPGAPGTQIKGKSIAAGREHACAVLDTSEIVCWGKGADGQLGDGTAGGPPRTMPVFVLRP
jgi:alpha-tubulin suppressor-like RCC1 family protein